MGKHSLPRRRLPWRLGVAALALAFLAAMTPVSPVPATAPEAGAHTPARPGLTVPADAPAPDFTRTPVPPVLQLPSAPVITPLVSFLGTWSGRSPILPGYSSAQCVAIFSLYHYDVVGGAPYSVQGAQDLWALPWHEYARVPATDPALPGDIVIWSGSHGAYQGGGYGHVAIVVADHGPTLAAFGQNPNPAAILELSKSGVLGYLRPLTPTN